MYTFLRSAGNAQRELLTVQILLALDTLCTYEDTASDDGVIATFRGE